MANDQSPGADEIRVTFCVSRDELRRRGARGGIATRERHDPRALTEPGRRAFLDRFLRQVDPHNELDPEERARRVADARRRYFSDLAKRAAAARRAKRAAAVAAPAAAEAA